MRFGAAFSAGTHHCVLCAVYAVEMRLDDQVEMAFKYRQVPLHWIPVSASRSEYLARAHGLGYKVCFSKIGRSPLGQQTGVSPDHRIDRGRHNVLAEYLVVTNVRFILCKRFFACR